MVDSAYLQRAPFSWVSVMIRFGLNDDDSPAYQRINRKNGVLDLSIEIDTHRVLRASEADMRAVFKEAVLRALIHIGRKYDLSIDRLEAARG